MRIGKFIFNRILNRRQREIIFQALDYSAHTYKRRNDADGYSEVSRVIGELSDKFGLKERTYTKEEVNEIIEKSSEILSEKINGIAKRAYAEGFKNGVKNVIPIGIVSSEGGLQPGMQFSKEKCESCEHKDECSLYSMLKEEFDSESEGEKKEEEKDSESEGEKN